MQIAHVNKYYHPHVGGIEAVVRVLAEEQVARHGLSVHVAVCNEARTDVISMIEGVRVERYARNARLSKAPLSLGLWRRVASLTHEVDIVHFHHPFPTGELALLRAAGPARTVVTWHSDIVRQRVLLAGYRPFLHRFLERVDRILVTSPNYLESSAFLGPYRDKCEIVPLGVESRKWVPTPAHLQQAARIRAQFKGPVVLYVGRNTQYKGLPYLLEAMRTIEGELLVVTPDAGSLITNAAAEFGVADRVRVVTGVPNDELPAYYSACDVFALPSTDINEAFGLVQVEAMLAGKPVVSTDLPTGVIYVNRNGVTGLTVPVRDPQSLAGAVNTLFKDPQYARTLGEQARRRAAAEFTSEVMTQRVVDVYRSLVPQSTVQSRTEQRAG